MTSTPARNVTSHRRRASRLLAAGSVIFVAVSLGLTLGRSRPEAYVPGADSGTSDEITRSLDRRPPRAVEDPAAPGRTPVGPMPSEGPAERTNAREASSGARPAGGGAAAGEGPASVTFSDQAEAAGLRFRHFHGRRSSQLPEDMGSGLAWGDYDGDGDPDLILVNASGPLLATKAELASSPAHARLYRNEGGGRFVDVTDSAGVAVRGLGMGAAWGDYDADGDLDLFVTRYGTNLLFRNDGGGRFSDVSEAAGVARFWGFWAGASWADYDRDGDLDLYVCGYVKYEWDQESAAKTSLQFRSVVPFTLNPSSYAPQRNLLLRNDGGVFREVAKQAGVDDPSGRSLSASWADFDSDGWPDLYVANDVSDNALYHNLGNGRFGDISHSAWVADYRGAMGLAVGDWENDGDLDIFVTHWIAQENALYANETARMKVTPDAPLRFVDQADITGLGQIALDVIGWGVSFLDYDNDGRLDLFVANGSTFQRDGDPSLLVAMKNFLFWNAGEHGYHEVGGLSGEVFARPNVGRGAAPADYDADGDLDLALVVHEGPARLLRNEGGNRGGWLRVVLRSSPRSAAGEAGHRSTTFAVGARLVLSAGGTTQLREVGAGSSYLSQEPPGEVFFGLGELPGVDRLEVRWPSGLAQTLEDLPVPSTIRLVEGRPHEVRRP